MNILSQTILDPDQLKSQNELAKTQLKKKLAGPEPGPGSYNPNKPQRFATFDIAEVQDMRAGNLTTIAESKHAAFNTSSPRFDEEKARAHLRIKSNVQDIVKPVYDLQLLEGPQMRARNLFASSSKAKLSKGISLFKNP